MMGVRAQQKEKTRRSLVEAAFSQLSAERSFASLSLREVAREAGIAPTSFYRLNLQSKCNKKRSTHQLEYNFVSTQKPLPNDEYFLPTSYNKRA
ncbi:TetR family transcriptional regulator, partial [Escherichia coli]|uniref:TetR family transcriptional regulator n=1 Tax=Escherichia coli TaxID=562 RepID=UPI0030C6FF0D